MQPNGSYITTEWFHICYFPVYPLRRIRITPIPGQAMVQELPQSVTNILGTYAFAIGYLVWMCGCFWLIFGRNSSYLDDQLGLWLSFVGVAIAGVIPFGVLWLIRRESFRARYGSKTN